MHIVLIQRNIASAVGRGVVLYPTFFRSGMQYNIATAYITLETIVLSSLNT